MKFVMHYRAPFTKQLVLLDAVRAGAKVHGITVEGMPEYKGPVEDADGLILYGIGGMSKEIFDGYVNAGKQTIFFDKGYARGAHLRVAVNCFQPLDMLSRVTRPMDRFEKLRLTPHKYAVRGEHILFDGASNKFCLWKELGNWLEWGQRTVDHIWMMTTYPVLYRPRPSHNNELTNFGVANATLSLTASLAEDFARTRLCVSYGGNIGWDCALAGVPHFAIGDSIARPISETEWDQIGCPYIPSEMERLQWFANVAYWQWTLPEISSGEAWAEIKGNLRA